MSSATVRFSQLQTLYINGFDSAAKKEITFLWTDPLYVLTGTCRKGYEG